MPNSHSTLTSLFSDIADAIRAKTGDLGTIVADNFPTAIAAIPTGGSSNVKKITGTTYYDSESDTISFTVNTGIDSAPIYAIIKLEFDTPSNYYFLQIGTNLIRWSGGSNQAGPAATINSRIVNYLYNFDYSMYNFQDPSGTVNYEAYYLY